jgi:hypothetical protein
MNEATIDFKPNIDEPDIVEVDIVEQVIVNTSNYSFTKKKYKVRDELINCVRAEAAKVGFAVVVEETNIYFMLRKR